MQKSRTKLDRMGRKEPVRGVPATLLIQMCVGLAEERMKEVPRQAVVDEKDDEIFVKCPCGHQPVVERYVDLFQKCGGCERYYLALTGKLWVVYGGMPVPGAPPAPVESA